MSRARDLSRLSSPSVFSVDATDASNNKVGVGSENPTAKLNVAGIVSATAFYGDGSNLDGVASAGLGTALADEGLGSVIYYTENTLGIGSTFVVTVPTGSDVAYTQYAEISLDENVDLIVTDGDEFIPDVLGLSTTGITPLTGAGGRIRADFFTNKTGTGAPTFQTGVNITGVATATSFSSATGSFTGDVDIADKIIHTGDTNTAIRFPAVDTFTVETAGSERLRITSAGKIGINQSTPQTTFHSTGTTNGQQATFGIDDSGLKISTFQKTDNDAGVILDAQKSSNGTLTFATAGTERLRILSGGGLTFNGDTATANALDDYEEGTWTPSVTNMTTTGSPAYGGRYRKIGSQVTIWFFTTTGGGVATYVATSNSTNVSGLPFASGYNGSAQSGGPPGLAVNGNTTAGAFLQGPGSSSTLFYFSTSISSTQGISASITYYV